RRAIVTRAVIEQSVGPVLVKPGGDPYEGDVLLNFQDVTFALALTRFLSERIRATN
ncbi:MAG: hypothetical protein JNL06_06845, partial [Alphaproteobacteria bacterium]|nr:hypothetical protein [Alphaproteobacteria bacterium]